MGYYKNRERARIQTIGSTLTDQSAAANTDINVIVRNAAISGTAPGSAKPPIYGDFSEIPTNLRDMLELSKSIEGHKQQLPAALQSMTVEELINADPQKLHARIQEEKVYLDRHAKLPQHLKSLSRGDILALNEKEFSDMVTPRQEAAKPSEEAPK